MSLERKPPITKRKAATDLRKLRAPARSRGAYTANTDKRVGADTHVRRRAVEKMRHLIRNRKCFVHGADQWITSETKDRIVSVCASKAYVMGCAWLAADIANDRLRVR